MSLGSTPAYGLSRTHNDLSRRLKPGPHVDRHPHALRAAFAVFFDEQYEQYRDTALVLTDLTGHLSLQATLVYLRRRDRDGRRWSHPQPLVVGQQRHSESPQAAEKAFEAKTEAEKEGFEPSMEVFTPITP